MLYEALAGRRPFDADTPLAIMNCIVAAKPAQLRRLAPDTPRDLELICHKCLETDARNRYPSAGQVADDLDRFLAGETISARPAGTWVVAQRWSRHNPLAAGLLLVSTLLLVGGLAAMTVLWQRADRQRQRAEENAVAADRSRGEAEVARQDARDALVFQQDLFQASDPFGFSRPVFQVGAGSTKDVTAKDLLDRGRWGVDARPLQTDESVKVFRQALALSREVYPASDPRVGDAAFYLAYGLLLQFGHHNPDRDEGQRLLDEAERASTGRAVTGSAELSRVRSAQLCLRLFREGPRLDPIAVAADFRADLNKAEKDLVTTAFVKYQFASGPGSAGTWSRPRNCIESCWKRPAGCWSRRTSCTSPPWETTRHYFATWAGPTRRTRCSPESTTWSAGTRSAFTRR